MAQQPIYDEGVIVDYFDDGSGEQPPEASEPEQVSEEAQEETPLVPETESPQEEAAHPWKVPEMLRTSDLFIGITMQHDDGNERGPLIVLHARELPEGNIHVKTFRAAELSRQAFLDDLQKGIASTMQTYLLAWADAQRKRLEEEAKRKARAAQARPPTPAPSVPTATKQGTSAASPPRAAAPSQKPSKPAPDKKYTTLSMFD